jgi:MFS family permease
MGLAVFLHVLTAALQLCTGYIYNAFGKDATYWTLFVAMFLFSVANGVCEVVVNPMTATLFPKQKTHYLNILHAGWPGGLIAGGLVSYFMNGGTIGSWAPIGKVHWMTQMSLFLVPVAIYGLMFLGQRLPRSEASEAGVSYATMLTAILAPLFFFLLFIHAMVGYVELGTDSWIAKITGTIMVSPQRGLLLFVYTSGLMFTLRFFAGPIVHRISPLGLLLVSALMGAAGLTLLGSATGVLMCVVAATVYGLGKTFFWPTMLAVTSEQFPKGGAIAIGMVGGFGMLSAGLLGGPGIGFKQDYFASRKLQNEDPAAFARYAADKENTFLGFFRVRGLAGDKVGILDLATTTPVNEEELNKRLEQVRQGESEPTLRPWWDRVAPYKDEDRKPIDSAVLFGGQEALKWTAVVPGMMAVCYLLLIVYFHLKGGYSAVHIEQAEEWVGEG